MIADWIKDCFSDPISSALPRADECLSCDYRCGFRRFSPLNGRPPPETAPVAQTVLTTSAVLQIPYNLLHRDWQFITFDCSADFNLLKISDPKYRPVDFMPLCGRWFQTGLQRGKALRVGVPLVP